jgi:hypothetical protein
MKQDILKLYTNLRNSLEEERARIQRRLKQIEAALGGTSVAETASPIRRGPGRPKGSTSTPGKAVVATSTIAAGKVEAPRRKYKRSAAARKRMAAAQKARFAKLKAGKAGKPVAEAPKPVAKPKRRTMTPAALKALAKAREARMAKLKAAKAKK